MNIHAKTFEHSPLCSTQSLLLKGFRLHSYSFFSEAKMLAVRVMVETLPQEDLSVLEDGNVLARPTGFKYRLVEILRLTAHG